jgi:DNA-binding NtrC family response regulator
MSINYKEMVKTMHKNLFSQILKENKNNKKKSADFLGLRRTTFIYHLKRLGLFEPHTQHTSQRMSMIRRGLK